MGRGTVGAAGSALDYMEENGTIDGSTGQVLEGFTSGFAKGTLKGAVAGFALGKFLDSTKYMKEPQAYCFVAGTLIVTALGFANIEDIRPGDYVYAENTETGEQAYMPVLETFSHEVSETYTVTIEGESIETTSGHPFYVVEEGWVGADELEAGDEVELADGGSGTVDSVEKNELDEPVTVYNFAVMDYHTYYVGENGALVHNDCTKPATGGETSSGKSSSNISELLENRPELTGTNREKLLSTVQDSKLASFINEVYRPGASVGDGGTADKLIMEFYEGTSRHLPKATERLVGINNIINSGGLGLNDLDVAEALRNDLEYAIDLFK